MYSQPKKEHVNRYFRTDIPLVAPEDPRRELRQRQSGFEKIRVPEITKGKKQSSIRFDTTNYDRMRGNRQFAYHVMALMVKKEYGDINAAMEEMIAVEAEWEHKPFLQDVDGEVKQVVPFSNLTKAFGGFHTAPAEAVETKEGEPEKVSFEWRTNLY